MTDLAIRGGTVVDGTGAPSRKADVGVTGGVISAVGDVGSASESIDADGLVVAPGFFDFHSHADFTIPNYPDPVNSISQGVTTEVMGNCGFSPAPVSLDPARAAAFKASSVGIGPDLDWRWSDFHSFLDVVDEVEPPVNCVPLVGHNAVRSAVMGYED